MGQTGPLATFAGFGNLAAAISGFSNLGGWPDRPPRGPVQRVHRLRLAALHRRGDPRRARPPPPDRRGPVHRPVAGRGVAAFPRARDPRLHRERPRRPAASATAIRDARAARRVSRAPARTAGSRSPSPATRAWRALCASWSGRTLADDPRFADAAGRRATPTRSTRDRRPGRATRDAHVDTRPRCRPPASPAQRRADEPRPRCATRSSRIAGTSLDGPAPDGRHDVVEGSRFRALAHARRRLPPPRPAPGATTTSSCARCWATTTTRSRRSSPRARSSRRRRARAPAGRAIG